MEFYAVWTEAWSMFHLQNGVWLFLLLKIPIIFWNIKRIMKTKAKVCNFWLWKFVTRKRSANKRSGITVLVLYILKIDDGMNEARANTSVGK